MTEPYPRPQRRLRLGFVGGGQGGQIGATHGNGARLSGIWVLDQVTRWQSLNWDYSGRLQKAQMDVAEIEADLDFRL